MLDIGRRFMAPLLGLAFATAATEAHAGFGSVTYTTPFSELARTDFNQTYTLPAFDKTLGGLESAVFTITENAQVSGSLLNKSATPRNFTINETVDFALSFGATQLTANELTFKNSYFNVLTGQTAMFGTYKPTGSGTSTITDQSVLDDLTGTIPLTFDFAASAQVLVTGAGGNTSNIFNTFADAQVSVTYNYITPNFVPEPASLAMTVLGGLLAAAGWGWKQARLTR